MATGQGDGRRGGGEGEGEGGEEETDIKSNNPHLTGGEKQKMISWKKMKHHSKKSTIEVEISSGDEKFQAFCSMKIN